MSTELSERQMACIPRVVFELIPIKNLVSNQVYQRPLSEGHIISAVKDFDVYQINPVKVSRRNGINYVFDGQHAQYGYSLNTLHSYEFEGAAGFVKMQRIMAAFRSDFREIEGRKVEAVKDYISGIDGLPPSDVLKYSLSGGVSLVVRPSGTEPKLKVYLSVSAKDQEAACQEERLLAQALSSYMDAVL